mmetsp:Transcript_1957/g.7445  ORF Transcript_1957/g.7445 Transcript_1957/m.7445 type:complete len:103 (+) Transcript_1957:2394-2702(+)
MRSVQSVDGDPRWWSAEVLCCMLRRQAEVHMMPKGQTMVFLLPMLLPPSAPPLALGGQTGRMLRQVLLLTVARVNLRSNPFDRPCLWTFLKSNQGQGMIVKP